MAVLTALRGSGHRTALFWTGLALGLSGCGNITNAVFLEDADFAAVFPAEGRTTLAGPPGSDTEVPPELLALTLGVGTDLNDWLLTVTSAADTVRSAAPTSRTADGRTWGAYDWSGTDLTASAERTGGARYDWVFDANGTGFTTGTHYAGPTVATGDGTFLWDQTALSEQAGGGARGRASVTYENREGVDLIVTFDDWTLDDELADPADATLAYTLAVGSGDFQFRAQVDLAGETAPAQVRTRWVENVGGRTDAQVSLEAGDDTWTQCWNTDGTLVYAADTLTLVDPVGVDASCALHGVELPDRI